MDADQVEEVLSLLHRRDRAYADDLLICAVAELDVFTALAARPMDERALGEQCGLAIRPTAVLITLLVAYGLLVRQSSGALRPTAVAKQTLVDGGARDLRPYFCSLRSRPAVQELLHVLRTDQPAPWASGADGSAWEESLADVGYAGQMTASMDARASVLGPLLAAALDLTGHQRLLDIGGGSGAYGRAVLNRWPHMEVSILERAPIDGVARSLLQDSPLPGLSVLTGSMFDTLPTGFDVHLYSHVLHDWAEDDVRGLLERSFAALPSGGCLVDFDAHLDPEATGPVEVAEYSALLMHSTAGRCYSVRELKAWLDQFGFVQFHELSVGRTRSVLVAHRP